MNIISFIPYGKENAVSRHDISRITGIPEREIRSKIKEANKELEEIDEAILSSSGGRGYWRTKDVSEMVKYWWESMHRISTQINNDLPIQRIISRSKGENLVYVKGYFRRIHIKSAQPKL